MKKLFAILAIVSSFSLSSYAQSHSDRITFGMGLLYERGLDARKFIFPFFLCSVT